MPVANVVAVKNGVEVANGISESACGVERGAGWKGVGVDVESAGGVTKI